MARARSVARGGANAPPLPPPNGPAPRWASASVPRSVGASASGLDADRDLREAAHVGLVGSGRAGFVHLVVGEAVADLLEDDARFEAREGLADADVVPVAEVDLALGVAVDVEAVGIRELALVAAGGAGDEGHPLAA